MPGDEVGYEFGLGRPLETPLSGLRQRQQLQRQQEQRQEQQYRIAFDLAMIQLLSDLVLCYVSRRLLHLFRPCCQCNCCDAHLHRHQPQAIAGLSSARYSAFVCCRSHSHLHLEQGCLSAR